MDKQEQISISDKFKIHHLTTIDRTLREILQNLFEQIKISKKKSPIQSFTMGNYHKGHYQIKPEHIWIERKILQTNLPTESISINTVVMEIHIRREINKNLNEEKILRFEDNKTFYILKIGDHPIYMDFQNHESIDNHTLLKLEELTQHIQELTKQNNKSGKQLISKLKSKTHNLIKKLF